MNDGDNPALEDALRQVEKARAFQEFLTKQQHAAEPILIGLGGRYGSGKDAFADFLVEQHGFVKLGMSQPLNAALLTLNPFIPVMRGWSLDEYFQWAEANEWHPSKDLTTYRILHEIVGYTEAKRVPEVRRLLQALGTDVGRNMLGEDVWVNAAARTIQQHRSAGSPVAITGIRYPNEQQVIKRLGGHLVWIERPLQAQRVLEALDDAIEHPASQADVDALVQHSSETSLGPKDFERIVLNDGSLDDLRQLAADLVRRLDEEDS